MTELPTNYAAVAIHSYRQIVELDGTKMVLRSPELCPHTDPLYGQREYCYGAYMFKSQETWKWLRDLQIWLRSLGVPAEDTMFKVDATREPMPVLILLAYGDR